MSFLLQDKTEHIKKIISLIIDNNVIDNEKSNESKQYSLERFFNRLGLTSDEQSQLQDRNGRLSTFVTRYCSDTPICENCPINKFCSDYRKKSQNKFLQTLENKLTYIDLFSGIGGMSLGFEEAGFTPVLAIDNEKNATSTYKFNRPFMPNELVFNEDIEKLLGTKEDFEENIPTISRSPKMVIGGFPCQSFSNANRQRIIDDPRNKLYKYTVKAVEYFKPEAIVLENVTGVIKIANQIIEDFINIGYYVDFRVLNAVDFGVPQNRKRVIFIGVPIKEHSLKNDILINKIFEEITIKCSNIRNVNLESALEGLRPLEASRVRNNPDYEDEVSGYKIDRSMEPQNFNDYLVKINKGKVPSIIYNHKARYNNDRDIEIFSRLPQGGKSDHPSIADIMPYKNRNGIFKDKYFKLVATEPCKTITAHMKYDCNMYIHPTQARGLTVREAARIQSFPDDYIVTGTFQKLYEQVGNSVPPLMSNLIAQTVKENILKISEVHY